MVDAGDVIIHLFRPEVREFYKLEKVSKDLNVADIWTKYVDKATLERLVKILMAFWLQLGIKVADAAPAITEEKDGSYPMMLYQESKAKLDVFVATAEQLE